MELIDKDALVAEIDRIENGLMDAQGNFAYREDEGAYHTLCSLENFINSLEVKEVDLVIHTIIAECCDWLAMTTNLSHDEIEGCRNLMLTVKEEQLKVQKGEKV